MSMEYEDLKIQSLAAGLLIDNSIRGIGEYSYEDYLLEFVNASSYFQNKSGQRQYYSPVSEAHGECDCISDTYQMDFKLFASSSLLQAKNLFSPQIAYHNGATIFSIPKVQSSEPGYKPILATRIFAALRRLTVDDFVIIRNADKLPQGVDRDIWRVLLMLETKKNLLLLFPYNFYFDDNNDYQTGLRIIIDCLNRDFKQALLYRAQMRPQVDTHLCFLYAHELIIARWYAAELQYVESIPIDKSPLFVKLLDFTDDTFSGGELK